MKLRGSEKGNKSNWIVSSVFFFSCGNSKRKCKRFKRFFVLNPFILPIQKKIFLFSNSFFFLIFLCYQDECGDLGFSRSLGWSTESRKSLQIYRNSKFFFKKNFYFFSFFKLVKKNRRTCVWNKIWAQENSYVSLEVFSKFSQCLFVGKDS